MFFVILNFICILSIILIGSTKNLSEKVLDLLLELVFNAMVVCVGLNELKNPRNIERLKRDIKVNTIFYYKINVLILSYFSFRFVIQL